MRIQRCVSVVLGLALIVTQPLKADVSDILGTTYSIANGFTAGPHPEGSHFHSSNLAQLPPGNPFVPLPGVAEVGGFFGDEEIRGVAEFTLQEPAAAAELRFEALDLFELGITPEISGIDGIFGQGSFLGQIDVMAYAGDDLETVSDFEIAPLATTPILSFEVGAGLVGGATFTLDVTDIYNELAEDLQNNPGSAATALGVRLQMAEPVDFDAGGITFGNFVLAVTPVPEPASGWLLLVAGLGLLATRRR